MATPHASVAQFRQYLQSLPSASSRPNATPQEIELTDARALAVLSRAADIIDEYLGFVFAAWPVAALVKKVQSQRSQYLFLPAYQQGSITEVNDGGAVRTDYEVVWPAKHSYLWRELGWSGKRVSVTAKWGHGPAPDSVIEINLELAANIWRGADRGMFSDAVGVDAVGQSTGGGGVAYGQMLTKTMKSVLDTVAAARREVAF